MYAEGPQWQKSNSVHKPEWTRANAFFPKVGFKKKSETSGTPNI